MSNDIERVEQAVVKMADSVHELTVTLTGYCAKQDGLHESVQELKQDNKDFKTSINTRFNKHDDRLRTVEQAVGVGRVFDDLNMNKLKNIAPWLISVITVLMSFYAIYKG